MSLCASMEIKGHYLIFLYIASGIGGSNETLIWNSDTGKNIRTLDGHDSEILDVRIGGLSEKHDKTLVATVSQNCVKLFRT